MMKRQYIFLILLSFLIVSGCQMNEEARTYQLFVGTYTDGDSEGIYSYHFNSETGELSKKTLAAALPNPSFLAISTDNKNIYAVQETADFDSLGGAITAFSIENEQLNLLNTIGTSGAHPCHVSLLGNVKLAVSNYSGGNVMVSSLKGDGSLGAPRQVIQHKATDTIAKPHAHMAQALGDELFVSDLGLDAIKRYTSINGEFVASNQPALNLPKGAGPRHFTFSKNKKFLYVINELNSTIAVFSKNADNQYEIIETKSTLSKDFKGDSFCGDIHLAKDGNFLYGSNRGENTIVIFKVDKSSGALTLVGREGVRGDWPRNFSLDPSNRFLLVANQKSNNITIFKRDPLLGTLSYLEDITLPSAVCLTFSDN